MDNFSAAKTESYPQVIPDLSTTKLSTRYAQSYTLRKTVYRSITSRRFLRILNGGPYCNHTAHSHRDLWLDHTQWLTAYTTQWRPHSLVYRARITQCSDHRIWHIVIDHYTVPHTVHRVTHGWSLYTVDPASRTPWTVTVNHNRTHSVHSEITVEPQ